jgi:hypothetical protein
VSGDLKSMKTYSPPCSINEGQLFHPPNNQRSVTTRRKTKMMPSCYGAFSTQWWFCQGFFQ